MMAARPHLLKLLWTAFCLGGLATTAAAQTAGQEPVPARLTADREQLQQLMIEQRIDISEQRPGLSLYLNDAGIALSRTIGSWLKSFLPGFARLTERWTAPGVQILLAVAVLMLIGLVARFAVRRWRGHPAAEAIPPPLQQLPEEAAATSANHWDSELRRRLAEDDGPAAAEALWWWWADRLVGEQAEAAWTSRELVTAADRPDLSPWVRRLDRMLYGLVLPSAPEVERLWSDLEEATG